MLGAVVVQWSSIHVHRKGSEIDVFGATEHKLRELICELQTTMGSLNVHKLKLPGFNGDTRIVHFAFIIQRAPHDVSGNC